MGNSASQIQCTSPLDIIRNLQTDKICKLKCSYKFKYAPTTLSIWNMGSVILLEVDDVAIPPVVYNDENYNLEIALLISPSIHTFNGNHADAELLLFHMNTRGTKKLMVCVPIKTSLTTTSDSATFFDMIMGEIALTAPSNGTHTIFHNATFSLNKFVPMAPYFSYTGANFLWNFITGGRCYKTIGQDISGGFITGSTGNKEEPFASDIDYIVFHVDDAITMSPQALTMLKKCTPEASSVNIPTVPESSNPTGLFYNPNGPVSQSDGDIYIDCQPTGDDGEILVTARQDTGGLLDNALLKKIWNFTFMKMIVGVLLMMVIWIVAVKIIDGIASNSVRMSGGASNNK